MADEIKNIYARLRNIKDNLVKLSYPRRTQTVLQQKLNEAIQLRIQFDECMLLILEQTKLSNIESNVLEEIQSYCDLFKDSYEQIESFCSKSWCTEVDLSNQNTMASFDFKTAVSLLPVMTGDEAVTKSLIDAIELYSSTLQESSKAMLINFVLKTRLNESAKLRLSNSYADCESLIKDMRDHLLTRKSSTSIHNELVMMRQNGTSIDNYGKKIEELFVNLTVSQADGNQEAYKILRPLNEKLAIKSFTDGLRNRQLSTILSARNYSSLKDTIRAAKDEEASCSRQNSEATMYFGNRGRSNTYRNSRGNYRGNSANRSSDSNSSFSRGYKNNGYVNQSRGRTANQPQGSSGYRQNRSYRGGRQSRSYYRGHNVHYMNNNTNVTNPETVQTSTPNQNQNSDTGDKSLLQFFR